MNRSDLGRNIAIGAAMALSVTLARAADELPKAETILDKYVEATGGKAAYQKHHSEISKGTLELSALGLKGAVTSYRAEPDKSLTEIDLGSLGKSREGSDGKVFWSLSSMMGPHVKEGPEKAQAMLSAKFNAELNWRDIFKDVKTTGYGHGGREGMLQSGVDARGRPADHAVLRQAIRPDGEDDHDRADSHGRSNGGLFRLRLPQGRRRPDAAQDQAEPGRPGDHDQLSIA
jgi:hypothetical protein